MRRRSSLIFLGFAVFAGTCRVDLDVTDLTPVTPTDVHADPDGICSTRVTLAEVLADPAFFDGRKVKMNVRLGLYDECLGIACLDEDPCCGSCMVGVIFVEPDCPFENSLPLWGHGTFRDPETGNRLHYRGDGCAVDTPPLDLLGPKVEFEVGAEYMVSGAIEFTFYLDGEFVWAELLLESASKIGPRCPG